MRQLHSQMEKKGRGENQPERPVPGGCKSISHERTGGWPAVGQDYSKPRWAVLLKATCTELLLETSPIHRAHRGIGR